jgi:hypothetical protein
LSPIVTSGAVRNDSLHKRWPSAALRRIMSVYVDPGARNKALLTRARRKRLCNAVWLQCTPGGGSTPPARRLISMEGTIK